MDGRFRSLLREVFADPTRGDYSSLRLAWPETSTYQPYGRDIEGLEELHMRVAGKQYETACGLAKGLLDKTPLSVTVRLLFAQALDGVGEDWEAGDHRAFAHGLCKALLRSGDGRSAGSALVVTDPSEIKLALDLLGLRALRSVQQEIDGRWFDRLDATGAKGEREVWFDVTLMQNWLAQAN